MAEDKATLFDRNAKQYNAELSKGLSLSGENADYFALTRIDWLAEKLSRYEFKADVIVDYGCGNGGSIRYLDTVFLPKRIEGLDTSGESLSVAREQFGNDRIAFFNLKDHSHTSYANLVFSNGTFHHIAPADRLSAIERIYSILKPGGYFALWENNPWSIGARLVMSRIPFDKDAVMVYPGRAMAMLRVAGFTIIEKSYRFIFPKSLKAVRILEPPLSWFPLGAQYLIISRKP
jgi:SAM-dependent methyltransferase